MIVRTSIKQVCGEFIVRAYGRSGAYLPACDYFTNDKSDAQDTAALMVLSSIRRIAEEHKANCAIVGDSVLVCIPGTFQGADFTEINYVRTFAELAHVLGY